MTVPAAPKSTRRPSPRLLAVRLLCASLPAVAAQQALLATPALAASGDVHAFEIPRQPLGKALRMLADQSGIQLAYRTSSASGYVSPPVSGRMTTDQALAQLLASSSLRYSFTDTNTVTILDKTAPAAIEGVVVPGAIPLDPIDIDGPRTLGAAPPPYAGGQVATGARIGILGNRPIMDTPFNVTSYTAKTINDQQARTIADVVKNDPSVRTTWADGSYSNQFFIRGFAVGNPDISINGLYGLAPYQMAGTSWVDRVEILKGPSAMLTGMPPGGSIGGNINLVPKRAQDDPLTQFTLGYVSNGQFGGSVDVGRRFGDNKELGVRANASYLNGRTPVDGQSNELGSAALGLDYRGDRLRLSADLIYQKNYSNDPVRPIYYRTGFQIPRAPKASSDLGQNWYYANGEDYIGIVRGEYDVTDDITVYGTFGGHRNTLLGLYNFEYIKNAAGAFDANNYFQPTYNDAWTGEVGTRARFVTGPIRHELTISASRLYSELGNRPQVISTYTSNLYAPAITAMPSLAKWYDWTPKTNASTLSSVAVADSIYMLDDRLQFIVGGRFQEVKQQAWNVTTGARTADYDKSAVTPAVAIVVKPWDRVSFYGNFIEGLSQGPTAPAGSANYGTTFAPIKSRQYEAGVKVDFGRITTTAAVFQIEQPLGYLNPANNTYAVDGEIRNRGVEFNVFGEIVDQLRLLGGVAFMDGVQTKTLNGATNGYKAVGVPDAQVNLGAEWDLPFVPGLTLSGRLIYTSMQYASNDNLQSIPSWSRVDVGARYTIERPNRKPITIRANVENLFNASYWAAASSTFGLARGAPRTFMVSTSFDL